MPTAKAESTAAEYLLAAAAAVLFDFGQARRACRVIAILDALAVVLKASRRAQASPTPLLYCQEILEGKCALTKKEGTFRKVSSSHFTLFFSECFAPFSP